MSRQTQLPHAPLCPCSASSWGWDVLRRGLNFEEGTFYARHYFDLPHVLEEDDCFVRLV